ncbi:AzlD domain-containing protein [Neobacillus fumarioli]|uniref:AzlD domain-containing protein n=1 Tax=Neobacillus fumarioli TaxID=105229 RepID=UPI000830DF21|nr:AzlD domain-containing protein [Neobacillus fumarioli]
MWNNWLLIIILAILTYISRIAGIEALIGRQVNSRVQMYLNYVPAGAISALVASQLFYIKNGKISLSFPVIVAGIIVAICMKIFKSFLLSVIIGVIAGSLITHFIR